jgi:hypothetical protein
MPPDVAGLVANTPTPCSCMMCTNVRRGGGWTKGSARLTVPERNQILTLEEELNDYYQD